MDLRGEIVDRNSYIDIFKHDKVVSEHRNVVQNKPTFVFDQVMEDKKPDANVEFPLPRAEKYVANEGRGYCQKLPRESIWRQKTRAAPKEVQHVPLTSAQVVGWRPPIDNLMSPHMG